MCYKQLDVDFLCKIGNTAGPNASLEELVDFIGVAQMAKAEDALLPPEEKVAM